jgi:polyisoprenoid-binding protein YceI
MRLALSALGLAFTSVALAAPARAQAPAELVGQKYEVDTQHSSVGFTARILRVIKVPGRFLDYSATIIYDPARPEQASVTAVIASRSISTDMSFRDDHLKSPDFLDTARYSLITFQSDSVRPRDGVLMIIGRLTLHGVTRTIAFSATIVLQPDTSDPASGIATVAFEASLKLSRHDFGIAGTNRFNPGFDPATNLVADSFDVALDVSAQHQGYRNRHFRPGPPASVGDTLLRTIESRGAEDGVRLFGALRSTNPRGYDFGEAQLDLLGHVLAERGRLREAVAIFLLNSSEHPTSASAFDALGEAECLVGDRAAALRAFERAASLDSTDTTPIEMQRRLRGSPR